MGEASILTQTSSSLIGTGGSSFTLQTASGAPCSSYTTAFDGGDMAEENERTTLFDKVNSLHDGGRRGGDCATWRWKAPLR